MKACCSWPTWWAYSRTRGQLPPSERREEFSDWVRQRGPGDVDANADADADVDGGGAGDAAAEVRRELTVSVQAGEKTVLEYVINNTPQTQWGLAEQLSPQKREQKLQAAYGLVDRQALPGGHCAIQHAPSVVGWPAQREAPATINDP